MGVTKIACYSRMLDRAGCCGYYLSTMDDKPLTIGQAAKQFDIPKGTVRGWVNNFSEYLSESANPPKGETKLLTPDDMTVLYTVYFLRARHKSIADIHEELSKGFKVFPETEEQPEPETPADANQAAPDSPPIDEEESAVAIYEAFSNTLQLYESRVASYEAELKEERAARLAAEIRATAAETKLQVLEDAKQETTDSDEAKPGFWQRLFGG